MQRYEQQLLILTENASEHCIYAIGPLRSAVVENELIIRCLDSAVYKFFCDKHDFADVGTARILQCRFLCDFHINVSAVVDDLARLRVDLVAVLILRRVKFQYPAGTTLIAAQLLLGKDNLFRSGNFGICKCNGSCFLKGYKQCHFIFCNDVAVYRVDTVCPLRMIIFEYKMVVGIFDSFVNKYCLGKCNPCCTAGVVQSNRLCLQHADVFCVDNNGINLLLQADKLIQRQFHESFRRQVTVFRRVTDKLCLSLRNAVLFRKGYIVGIIRFGNINQSMHGGFFFKYPANIFRHSFFELAIFA